MAKPRTIAEELKAAIAKAQKGGWSVNAIAQRAGISQGRLSDWLAGRRTSINLETAQKLADMFRMRLTSAEIPPPPE